MCNEKKRSIFRIKLPTEHKLAEISASEIVALASNVTRKMRNTWTHNMAKKNYILIPSVITRLSTYPCFVYNELIQLYYNYFSLMQCAIIFTHWYCSFLWNIKCLCIKMKVRKTCFLSRLDMQGWRGNRKKHKNEHQKVQNKKGLYEINLHLHYTPMTCTAWFFT